MRRITAPLAGASPTTAQPPLRHRATRTAGFCRLRERASITRGPAPVEARENLRLRPAGRDSTRRRRVSGASRNPRSASGAEVIANTSQPGLNSRRGSIVTMPSLNTRQRSAAGALRFSSTLKLVAPRYKHAAQQRAHGRPARRAAPRAAAVEHDHVDALRPGLREELVEQVQLVFEQIVAPRQRTVPVDRASACP